MTSTISARLLTIILLLIVTTGQMAVDIYLPSMPAMAHDLQTSATTVQLTLTIYLLGFGASQLVYGPIADRFGRRHVVIFGMSLFLLASVACIFAPNIETLLLSRLLQGVGIGSASVLVRAIMRDKFHGPALSKMMSHVSIVWSLTPITAPLIGGYIQEHLGGWRINFVVMFGYVLLILCLVLRYLPETLDKPHLSLTVKTAAKNYWSLLSNPVFISFAVCSTLAYAMIIAYSTASPFLLQEALHFTPVEYGWICLLIASAFLLGSVFNSSFIIRVGEKFMLNAGLILTFVSSVLLFIFAVMNYFNAYTLLVPVYIALIGAGLLYPNFTIGSLAPFRHMAATTGALLGALQMAGCALASVAVAKIHAQTQLPLAIIFLVIAALIAVIYIGFIRKRLEKVE